MTQQIKKNKSKNKFKKFLLIYTSVLTIGIIIIWVVLFFFIKDYEQSRPSTVMDRIVEQLKTDEITDIVGDNVAGISEFDSKTEIYKYVSDATKNKEIIYKKKPGEYSELTPVYDIYSDNQLIAKLTLDADGKNKFGFTKWKKGTFTIENKNSEITITAPKDAQVTINGIALSDNYIVENDKEFVPCKNVSTFIQKPLEKVYKVVGMVTTPDIKVQNSGQDLEVKCEGTIYTAMYKSDEQLLVSQKDRITEISQNYGKYIINRCSLSVLTKDMVGHAKEYMSDIPAVWAYLYGKTYKYEFKNFDISEFYKYSEDCFSCKVYYDLYVDWGSGNKTYNTQVTYTFVKYNNQWVVADFILN